MSMADGAAPLRRAPVIGLASKNLPLIAMSVLARGAIVPPLIGVPGVVSVSIWGQRDQ